jgi:hypothetical protein
MNGEPPGSPFRLNLQGTSPKHNHELTPSHPNGVHRY